MGFVTDDGDVSVTLTKVGASSTNMQLVSSSIMMVQKLDKLDVNPWLHLYRLKPL